MATHSPTTFRAADQTPSPDHRISPVEDEFTELLDGFDLAVALESALEHHRFDDPAHAVSFDLADAAWLRAFERLDTVLDLEPESGFCAVLQHTARLMKAAMAEQEAEAIYALLEGTVLRQRLWPLFGSSAVQRRTLMLVDHAMRLLAQEAPRLARTLPWSDGYAEAA